MKYFNPILILIKYIIIIYQSLPIKCFTTYPMDMHIYSNHHICTNYVLYIHKVVLILTHFKICLQENQNTFSVYIFE